MSGRGPRADPGWSTASVGGQSGRVAVVTGANTGIGYEVARALAAVDATVVLGCRDRAKGEAAARRLVASVTGARVVALPLDLASLESIAAFARLVRDRWAVVDLLVNNAGVMAAGFERTEDGFELDFGVNFLGHFALTGQLIDPLGAALSGRVVTVGSVTHRRRSAALDFADPRADSGFGVATAYSRSKLASMTFMVELQRRLAARGATTLSVAAHPGGVRTDILHHQNPLLRQVFHPRLAPLTSWFTQSPAEGARPILRAALDPAVRGGDFFGPGGRGELVGPPVPVAVSRRAYDRAAATRLWELAQDATGVRYLDEEVG